MEAGLNGKSILLEGMLGYRVLGSRANDRRTS